MVTFGQSVWNWIKGNLPFPFPFEKKTVMTGTIKASPNLPAGAGKFLPVTRGNRRHSLPAEIFACMCRYFYLQIILLAAFAVHFARASFTVYPLSKKMSMIGSLQTQLQLKADILRYCLYGSVWIYVVVGHPLEWKIY